MQARECTAYLLKLLEEPEHIIEASTQRLININRHSRLWTLRNQILMVMQGASDAATEKAWTSWGRKVLNDDRPVWIIAPLNVKDRDPESRTYGEYVMRGFRDHKVFGIENTEVFDEELWTTISPDSTKAIEWLSDMMAKYNEALHRLNLDKLTAAGGGSFFEHPILADDVGRINLGRMEEQVFLHEMAHAIEYKNKNLTIAPGQQPDNELVAEFSAAALMLAQD